MAKLQAIETEVEQFLPDYFLPDQEQAEVRWHSHAAALILVCSVAVCGGAFFLWSNLLSGNNEVVAGGVNIPSSKRDAGQSSGLRQVAIQLADPVQQHFSKSIHFAGR